MALEHTVHSEPLLSPSEPCTMTNSLVRPFPRTLEEGSSVSLKWAQALAISTVMLQNSREKCDSTSTSMLNAEASAVWLSMNKNGRMWLMQMTWITSDRLEIPYHSLLLVRSFARRHDNRPATFLCSVVAYWRAHTPGPPRHFGARFTGRGCRAQRS